MRTVLSNSVPTMFRSDRYGNRWFHEVMPDGAWAGKPCFLVGGGPSLEHFNWGLLRGKRTIGINRAYERFEPTIVFSMDTRFLNWVLAERYGPDAKARFLALRSYKVWNVTYACTLPGDIFVLKSYRGYNEALRAFPFSQLEGIGHGNNSGYGALNLACCLGASPIYLLGYDMQFKPLCQRCGRELGPANGQWDTDYPKHKRFCNELCFRAFAEGRREADGVDELHITHWHDGHPYREDAIKVEGFRMFFEGAVSRIRARGLKVVNLNPQSALECFPKQDPAEVLH